MDARPHLNLATSVLVVVGGAAGVAAAYTAATTGARVLPVERYGFCGGAAVAGLSGAVCGMYAAAEGAERGPKQIVFGFADRFVKAMCVQGGLSPRKLPVADLRDALKRDGAAI